MKFLMLLKQKWYINSEHLLNKYKVESDSSFKKIKNDFVANIYRLKHDIQLAPEWIRGIMRRALQVNQQ